VQERVLDGVAAAAGVAIGRAVQLPDAPQVDSEREGEEDAASRAVAALGLVASELRREARWLRTEGHAAEAEILEANELMALDPTLAADVKAAAAGVPAATALAAVTERHADGLAALADPVLAARADDVRQIGRRAVRALGGDRRLPEPTEASVLVAADLGPGDVAELQSSHGAWVGIAVAAGSATSHAAIMARALGLPMVVALGAAIVDAVGSTVVVDGDGGRATVAPGAEPLARARARIAENARAEARAAAGRALPSFTRDGREVVLLCNAATAADAVAGIAAGAAGAGLVRTELAFLEARAWPTEAAHATALAPVLEPLAGRLATVRVLDFGEDKTPPFLAGTRERGISLLLQHPDALRAQLRAILRTGRRTRLRILLPLVETAAQVRDAYELLQEAADLEGWRGAVPPLGAMIETPAAAARAVELAEAADFLSIGTNDLVQYTLGLDRSLAEGGPQAAADPAVLAHVAAVAAAAAGVDARLEVCGEAAGEPACAVLLVGLGVDELSASPPRLDALRAAVREMRLADAQAAARAALGAPDAQAALRLARELLGEVGDDLHETVGRLGGAVA
jgi:phosphoenolpyruvate-protein kinase (PTS system EI component)